MGTLSNMPIPTLIMFIAKPLEMSSIGTKSTVTTLARVVDGPKIHTLYETLNTHIQIC